MTMGGQSNQQARGAGSPISNEAYNVLTALQSKLEGLEAYRKYAQDGNGDLWRDLAQQDTQSIERLVKELEQLVQNGRLRMATAGPSR